MVWSHADPLPGDALGKEIHQVELKARFDAPQDVSGTLWIRFHFSGSDRFSSQLGPIDVQHFTHLGRDVRLQVNAVGDVPDRMSDNGIARLGPHPAPPSRGSAHGIAALVEPNTVIKKGLSSPISHGPFPELRRSDPPSLAEI